jgi:hypothetical protein
MAAFVIYIPSILDINPFWNKFTRFTEEVIRSTKNIHQMILVKGLFGTLCKPPSDRRSDSVACQPNMVRGLMVRRIVPDKCPQVARTPRRGPSSEATPTLLAPLCR